MDLVVVRPFGVYGVGDRIADATQTSEILRSENASNVVRVTALAPVVTISDHGES